MSACRRYRPAGGERRISLLRSLSAAFAPNPWARPPGFLALGVTCAFAYATARRTRGHPQDGLSAGFKGSVSFPLAAQATGLWLLPWHRYLLLSTLSISLVAQVAQGPVDRGVVDQVRALAPHVTQAVQHLGARGRVILVEGLGS